MTFIDLVAEAENNYAKTVEGKSDAAKLYTYKTEVTADLMGELLSNEQSISRLVDSQKNIAYSIYSWVKNAVSRFVNKGDVSNGEYRFLRKVERLYVNAMRNSVGGISINEVERRFEEFAKKTEEKESRDNSRYSLDKLSESEIYNLRNSDRVQVAQRESEIRDFIDGAMSGEIKGKKLILGKINSELAKKINSETGVDVNGFNLELRANEIYHIIKEHGTEATELSRGQRAVTANDIYSFTDIVTNYESVNMGKDNSLLFTKTIDGKVTAVTLYAIGNKSLSLKTMYINKKGYISPPDNAKSQVNNVQDERGTVSSNNSINETTENVNPDNKKGGERYAIDTSVKQDKSSEKQSTTKDIIRYSLSKNDIIRQDDTSNNYDEYLPSESSKDFKKAVNRFSYPIKLYRGMELAEYESIINSGYIKSKGDYNFSYQQGRTYFSKKPSTAFSYATNFAPNEISEKFFRQGKHSYIIEVMNAPELEIDYGEGNDNNWTKFSTDELSSTGRIPLDYISKIYELTYHTEDDSISAEEIELDDRMNKVEVFNGYIPSLYKDKVTGTILFAIKDMRGENSGLYISSKSTDKIVNYKKDFAENDDTTELLKKYSGVSGNENDLVLLQSKNENIVRYSLVDNNKDLVSETETRGAAAYNYETLTAKPDMKITKITETLPLTDDGKINRLAVIRRGIANAKAQNNPKNTDTQTYVRVEDIGKDILIGIDGVKHGLSHIEESNAKATIKVGEILKNSIAINELNGRKTENSKTDMSYILLGASQDSKNDYAVRFVVDKISNEVVDFEILQLKAIRAKERSRLITPNAPGISGENSIAPLRATSIISIRKLLENVKGVDLVSSVLSSDVLSELGVERSTRDGISKNIRYSLEDGKGDDNYSEWQTAQRAVRKAKFWKDKYYGEKTRTSVVNRLLEKVQKIKDIKLGTFINASQFKSDIFKGSIESLSKIKFRGDLNKSGTRAIVKGLREWYVKDNPILDGVYDFEVASMLTDIATGTGMLTTEELRNLSNVVDYFKHFIETYNMVWRNGQYVEAQPIADKYIDIIHKNKSVKVGWFNKTTGTAYTKTFGDPMTVARRMDMYEDGFYTESLETLREASVSADIDEMEIRAELEAFLKKNKKYLKGTEKRTIKYLGNDIPLMDGLYVYLALGRKQAQLGLEKSGIVYDNGRETVRINGFKTESKNASQMQEEIFKQLSESDKQYIDIAKNIFNNECKERKRKTDIARRGYSNVSEDEYIPIRRAHIAHNVDANTYADEMNRVSNASFNKDTVQGAKQELFVEPLNKVLDRHIHAVAQYANLSTAIDEYNKIFNLDISGNKNKPISVATESKNTWKDGNEYFTKLISDIQGIPVTKGVGNRAVSYIRSSYAKCQLGMNPKVWLTQLSSFAAAGSILDVGSIFKGIGISAKDIDQYCPLAKLRNNDNTAAMAQGVLDKVDKVGNALMKPIGKVDRFVVKKLFGACQVQVEKNNGLKVGTQENKVKAGELLKNVILETQQNSMATERSAAMRSGSEFMKTVTMFSADSMKVIGRVIDSVGELTTLKAKKRIITDTAEIEGINKKIKTAQKKVRRSVASLVSSAVIIALIAQLFRTLYNKDDEDDNIVQNMAVDAIGNLFGGLPLIRDLYSKFTEGYDINGYAYSALNDILDSGYDVFAMLGDIFSGKVSSQDVALNIKKMVFAGGQILGLPTRNIYNIAYGLTKRFSPTSAYKIDNVFYSQKYNADLKKAIENDDEKMIATIVGIMLNENIGEIDDSTVRKELNALVSKGYSVLPRSVGDKITYEGEEITLTNKQKSQFKKIYSQANDKVKTMVNSSMFARLDDGAKAKAFKTVYDFYFNLGLEDLLGEDLENKNILFSAAIPIEQLAMAVAQAQRYEADLDKIGNAVSGSKKIKVQNFVKSLNLTAVQKYIVMGYLGYTNANGAAPVKAYINSLKLSRTQKETLYEMSGYKLEKRSAA